MNKWVVRGIGILMLVAFLIIFSQMASKLRTLQQQRQGAPATKSP